MMDEWKCPDGWRVKGDDETVQRGDAYSHDIFGEPHKYPNTHMNNIGGAVQTARKNHMPKGGFILTPVSSTPTTFLESHMKLNAINPRRFELIDKKSTVGLTAPEHMELERLQYEAGQCADVIAPLPPQAERHFPPLDIDLPYLLKKSAACSPEIQSQVLALKTRFAEMVGKLIEADRLKRISLFQTFDQKADSGTKKGGGRVKNGKAIEQLHCKTSA